MQRSSSSKAAYGRTEGGKRQKIMSKIGKSWGKGRNIFWRGCRIIGGKVAEWG
jgi:hypothetical protein